MTGRVRRAVAVAFRALVIVSVWISAPIHADDGQGSNGHGSDGQASEAWTSLLDRLEQLRQENRVPVLGIALFREGRLEHLRTLGDSSADTPLRWGSITKSVTALAALDLVRETELSLEAPIRPVLGDGIFENPWAATQPVRLNQLLELSAGFTDLTGAEFSANEPQALWEVLGRPAASRTVRWPPGLQHSYTNVAPGLTAAVIEQVSGRSFEDYVTERIFAPLGMTKASLEPVSGLPGGYQADGRTRIPYWHMTFTAFGALNASLSEMTRFAGALLNRGRLNDRRVLPEDLVDRFFTPATTPAVQAGLEVAYANGVYGWVRGGHVFWGHGGDADGYLSRYGLLRDHGRGYLLIINADNPRLMGTLRRLVEETLIVGLPEHAPPSRATDNLDAYTGTYYPAAARFRVAPWQRGEARPARVARNGETLRFRRGERQVTLVPAGGGRFFRPGDPRITVVFVPDSAGFRYLQGEIGNFVHLSGGVCPEFIERCE